MGSLFERENIPLICVPLTGKTDAEIEGQLEKIVLSHPDMIEWRADFYEQLDHSESVIQVIEMIKGATDIPLLFTIRSEKEGGERITLNEVEKVELLQQICRETSVDVIDYEVENDAEFVELVRKSATEGAVELILSYHHFSETPDNGELMRIAEKMAQSGADVAKLAVMPGSRSDVNRLLDITSHLDDSLGIPIITMSMGELGVISRIVGWAYGSRLTFAVGVESSAPGQVPVWELKKAIDAVQAVISG